LDGIFKKSSPLKLLGKLLQNFTGIMFVKLCTQISHFGVLGENHQPFAGHRKTQVFKIVKFMTA
jgi:hypothetical protein